MTKDKKKTGGRQKSHGDTRVRSFRITEEEFLALKNKLKEIRSAKASSKS